MQYLVLRSEHLFEEPLRFRETFLREHHRLRLSHWISDVSLLVKPTHRVPIEALPRSPFVILPRYRSATTARSIFSVSAFIGASSEKFSRGILRDIDPQQIVHSDPEIISGTLPQSQEPFECLAEVTQVITLVKRSSLLRH